MTPDSETVRDVFPLCVARADEAGPAPRFPASSDPIDLRPGAGRIASPETLRAWMATATAGARAIYARHAGLLPRGDAGAGTVRVLAGQGLVHPVQRPIAGAAERDYLIQRTAKAIETGRAAKVLLSPKLRALIADEADAVDALYPVLERAARFGLPCPTDAEMARKASLLPALVGPTLDAMRSAGLIALHAAPAPTLRRITIIATGARTGIAA